MTIEELLQRLQENAATAAKPVSVVLDGIGTVYVRKRTIREFEQIASLKLNENKDVAGMFAPSVARLLCDEEGNRFPEEHAATLAALIAAQPDDVFQKIMEATDGTAKKKEEVKTDPN